MKHTIQLVYCDICGNEFVETEYNDAMTNLTYTGYQVWPGICGEKDVCGNCCRVIENAYGAGIINAIDGIINAFEQNGYIAKHENDEIITFQHSSKMSKRYMRKVK